MPRVAVTGSSGKLGRAVMDVLTTHGYEAVGLDMIPSGRRGELFSKVDFTDYGETVDSFTAIDARHSGFDALVHLAAIPGPGIANNVATFHTNISITFNVFHSARQLGIGNIVYASSETLLGVPFDTPPPYLPVDEDYDPRPETTYSLVKHLEETMAGQLTRWDPALKIVGLRFSNVMDEADYSEFHRYQVDPSTRQWNLWSYVDHRDGAEAVLNALRCGETGFHVFNIAADDTVMVRPTAQLVAERFPSVPVKTSLEKHVSLISSRKARTVLGYAPQHSWRQYQL